MLAAPILLLIASLIHPPHAGSAESWLHAAESGPTRFYLAHLLFLGAAALLVPATLGLGRLAHPTQTTLTALGVGITLLGILGIGALVGSDFVVWKMADPSADDPGGWTPEKRLAKDLNWHAAPIAQLDRATPS
jgi:hypothetical protein